jgi:hypothetical protein
VGKSPTVYSENLTGAIYLNRPRKLQVYERVWTELAVLALNERDSNEMITAILKSQGDNP